jgi:hypothetical protein
LKNQDKVHTTNTEVMDQPSKGNVLLHEDKLFCHAFKSRSP